MQTDGNLVVYCTRSWRPIWASNTFGKVWNAIFQADGNLVIYSDAFSGVMWAPNVHNQGGHKLIMQDDANLVIYANGGHPIWATNTWGQC